MLVSLMLRGGCLALLGLVFLAPAGPARADLETNDDAARMAEGSPGPEADDLAEMDLADLMALEITSVSRKSERLSHTAAAVYVITNEDIRRQQKRTSGEILGVVSQVRTLAAKVQGATSEQRNESAQGAQAIEQVAGGLVQIRAATQNQLGASAEVETAREVFRQIAEENARRSRSLGEIVGALTDRAEALARAVGRFRV
ncbi:MAG: methyl-accepting chemotaxis protein [Deltaproteobacteria bacterium]|nr:methyl-accepting chemotaxis protein [Deltaproteobacteria bacterium]